MSASCDNAGRISIKDRDKQYLWAFSAGHCCNPACRINLFIAIGEKRIPFGELAHIIAATPGGPRDSRLSLKRRAELSNIVMLCANCHSVVDKEPDEYPVKTLQDWSRRRLTEVESVLGAVEYTTRRELRGFVRGLLLQNHQAFELYGPLRQKEEGQHGKEGLRLWKRKQSEVIVPNNRMLVATLDKNRHMLDAEEALVLERFRQHVSDVEARHFHNLIEVGAVKFPTEMDEILGYD